MKSDNSRIVKNSLILYIRLIITSVIGLIVSRLLLQNLGVSDFGLYSVVGGIVILLTFLNTIMISTTYRYIAFEMGKSDIEGVNKVFNISIVIHICIAVLLVLLSETLGRWYILNKLNVEIHRIDEAFFVFRVSIVAAFFNVLSIPFQGLITAKENFLIRASIETLKSVLTLVLVIWLSYYSGDKLRFYASLMALIMFIYALLFYLYCKKYYTSIIYWKFQYDYVKYKEMLGYSGWIMFGAATSVGQVQGSALIINSFFSTVLNASFGIANQVNSFLRVFSGSIGQAVVPQITKRYSSGNKDRSEQLAYYTGKYSFFLLLTLSVPILLETDYILKLWLVEVPDYAVIFTQLMIGRALLDSMNSGISPLIQATGKIKWFQLILGSMLLLSLPISYILFSFGYPPHTILVVFLGIGIFNILVRLILLKKIIHLNVNKLIRISYIRILYVCILIFPLFTIRQLYETNLSRFLISIFLSIFVVLLFIYIVGLDVNERNIVKSKILTIIKRGILK